MNEAECDIVDPISLGIMTDPVIAEDGHSYDRNSIELWFQTCQDSGNPTTSPLTNVEIQQKLHPNKALKTKLDEMVQVMEECSSSVKKVTEVVLPSQFGEVMASEIFEELDRVIALPVMQRQTMKVAQVVAIGMESHGKSTLLERLIGLPLFPKNRTLCTVCPLRVHLRRSSTVRLAEVCIRARRSGAESHKATVAMDRVRDVVRNLMQKVLTLSGAGALVSDSHEIVVSFSSPSMPNLDLVDLPGLVAANTSKNMAQDLVSLTYSLAQRVVQEEKQHSIFLLVVDVRTQVNHSRAAEIVREHNVLDQTIGVFTKLDCFVQEDDDDDMVIRKLISKELLTTHGWLGCVSRMPKLPIDRQRDVQHILEIERAEKKWLADHDEYAKLVNRNRMGMSAVRSSVLALFEDFLCHVWVPRIVSVLQIEAQRLSVANANECGLPIPMQNGQYRAVYERLQESLPASGFGINATLLRPICDNTIRSFIAAKIGKSLTSANDVFNLCTDSDANIFELISSYQNLVDSDWEVKNSPILLRAHFASNHALELCEQLIVALCSKIRSASFSEQLIAQLQRSKMCDATEREFSGLNQGAYFNLPRFHSAFNLLIMFFAQQLISLSLEIEGQLKESVRAFAKSLDGGFVKSAHCKKRDKYSNAIVWSGAGKDMANRIVDLWADLLFTRLRNALTLPVDVVCTLDVSEDCVDRRKEILEEMALCAEVALKMENIQASKSKLVFTQGRVFLTATRKCSHKSKLRKLNASNCPRLTSQMVRCTSCGLTKQYIPTEDFTVSKELTSLFCCKDCYKKVYYYYDSEDDYYYRSSGHCDYLKNGKLRVYCFACYKQL